MLRPALIGTLADPSSFSNVATLDRFWSVREIRRIKSLSLAKLCKMPPDSSNRVAEDTKAAASCIEVH